MRPNGRTLLLSGLVAIAVLVLHELRYLIGYGAHAGQALSSQGHGYLPVASTAVLLLLAVGIGQLLLALRRALHAGAASPAAPFGVLWLASVSALLAVYCTQELLEGVLSSGHPTGIGALAAAHGWSALPLAMALGTLVALALRGVAEIERRVAARGRRPRELPLRAARLPRRLHVDAQPPRLAVLAGKRAGRAPPRFVLSA